MRQLHLGILDFLDSEPIEFIECAASAGFDGVSLRAGGSTIANRADLDQFSIDIADVRRALEKCSLEVIDVEVLRVSPDLTVEEAEVIVDRAIQLRARHILTVVNGYTESEAVDRLAALAKKLPVGGPALALEFMSFTDCPDLESAIRIAQAIQPARLCLIVDAWHFFSGGGTLDSLRTIYTHHPEHFGYLQLSDGSQSNNNEKPDVRRHQAVRTRMLPGHGNWDLKGFISSFHSETPIVVEAPTLGSGIQSPVERAHAAFEAISEVLRDTERAT